MHGKHVYSFDMSKKIDLNNSYDINVRSVLESQSIGQNELTDFCSKMGLPEPVSKAPYNKITKDLCGTSKELTENLMNAASMRLRKMQFPDKTIPILL